MWWLAYLAFGAAVDLFAGHRAVDGPVARAITPGILTGSFSAALLAGVIPTRPLAVLFTALVFYAATQIFFDLRPRRTRELPAGPGLFAAGALIAAGPAGEAPALRLRAAALRRGHAHAGRPLVAQSS